MKHSTDLGIHDSRFASSKTFGGYAAYAFEQQMNGPTWVQPAGRGPLEVQIQTGHQGYEVKVCDRKNNIRVNI